MVKDFMNVVKERLGWCSAQESVKRTVLNRVRFFIIYLLNDLQLSEQNPLVNYPTK